MTTYPLISVVTAVYNDETFIRRSVESILQQSYTNFEYVIVDDGSTDNTPFILDELRLQDSRITVIKQKNSGAAAARNTAINFVKGHYIAIQDSDDISMQNRLEKQLNHLLNKPDNIISCTGYNLIDEKDDVFATHNKVYENINQNVLDGNTSICHPTLLIPTRFALSVGGYDLYYKKTEDYDLIFRLLEKGYQFEKLNECLYNYRIRNNSESSLTTDVYIKRAYENHINRINSRSENFSEIISNPKYDKKYVIKRQIRETFFTENYPAFRRLYLKNFFHLPLNNFLLMLAYSFLPLYFKSAIKTYYNRRGL